MDPVLASRLQFGLTVGFHYIFVPITIGLSVALVALEVAYLRSGEEPDRDLTQFFAGIFALNFAIGVATGIPMEFQFGTNWAQYSRYTGDIFGSALAAEGLFAFAAESGLLAIVLFGWEKVSRLVHFTTTVVLCLATHFSAVWILVANSWMQTPDGFRIVGEGAETRAVLTDFSRAVLNPSMVERFLHTIAGAWQAGAFILLSISAWYLLHGRHVESARRAFRIGLGIATVATSGSIISGDANGRMIARHQPAKLAAIEGVFDAQKPRAPLHLFGWVDTESRTTYGPAIPGLLSFLAFRDVSKPVTGLEAFPRDEWPPVNATFQTYHIMVAIGFATFGITLLGLIGWMRGWLFEKRWLLWMFVFAVPFVLLANQLGWLTAELGRQPWVVYGHLRTGQGVSSVVRPQEVWGTIAVFSVVYGTLGFLYFFLLNQKIQRGPGGRELTEQERERPTTVGRRTGLS